MFVVGPCGVCSSSCGDEERPRGSFSSSSDAEVTSAQCSCRSLVGRRNEGSGDGWESRGPKTATMSAKGSSGSGASFVAWGVGELEWCPPNAESAGAHSLSTAREVGV